MNLIEMQSILHLSLSQIQSNTVNILISKKSRSLHHGFLQLQQVFSILGNQSFNYLLIFLWVSFFSLLFFDPAASSGLFYLGVYLVFVLCFGTFLFLINLFYRKMDHSLFTLSCNLITLFFCGVTSPSMNNLTHYLHVKGPSLQESCIQLRYRYDIGFSVIPEIPLKYAETSDVILVSYILLCVLRSLFLHPAVRNKMWADFGRISSIMILCKVKFNPTNKGIGCDGMVDTPTRTSTTLPSRHSQLRASDGEEHLYQPGHHVRSCTKLW